MKIGELFMEGPRLGQSLECVRGQPCELDVKGEELQAGEKLLALLGCGTGSRITGFPADGVASTAGHFSFGRQSTADGLPADVVDAQAGIYRASRKTSCVGSFCQLWCATHNGCSHRSIPLHCSESSNVFESDLAQSEPCESIRDFKFVACLYTYNVY